MLPEADTSSECSDPFLHLLFSAYALRIPHFGDIAGKTSLTLTCLSILSLTCRSRKLKCDEQKPQCSQCQKARRECRPSEGVVFRHQQNASMNKGPAAALPESSVDPDGSKSPLKGFYSYRNSFGDDNVWLEIPKTGMCKPHIRSLRGNYSSETLSFQLNIFFRRNSPNRTCARDQY